MSRGANSSSLRLAVPLVKYGESLVEDIEGYEIDEDIELTPVFETVLQRDFVQYTRDVQIQGRSFRANVFESKDEGGPTYVVTTTDRVPVSVDNDPIEEQTHSDVSAEALAIFLRHRSLDNYLDTLHDRVATCESLLPTGLVPLKSRFVPPKFAVIEPARSAAAPDEPTSSVFWTFDDLQRVSRVVILGSPGAGKTSLLRRLALDHSSERTPRRYFPVYIQLRDLASPSGEQGTLNSAVTRVFESAANVTLDEVAGTGRIMLLLDGLDEMPPGNRDSVVSELRLMCSNHPQLAVIVTCRSQSYSGGLESFQHLAIRPFDDSQIEQWVYTNLGEDDTRVFLKNMLAEPTVHSAARWPLLLTIAVDLFKSYGTLSRSRSFLYQSCVDALSDEWDRVRGVKRFDFTPPAPEKVVRTLCQIAHRTVEDEQEYFTVDDFARWNVEKLEVSDREFLEFIRESTGLLSCRDSTEWRFRHQSFRDYLAAECLVRSTGESAQLLSAKISDHAWRDVWQFASERTVDASDLFRRALTDPAPGQFEILVMLVATLLRDASVTKDVEESVAEQTAKFLLAELAGGKGRRPDLQVEASGAGVILDARFYAVNSEHARRLVGVNTLLQSIYLNRTDRFVTLIFRKLRALLRLETSDVVDALERGVDYDGQVEMEGEVESLQAKIALAAEPPPSSGFDI